MHGMTIQSRRGDLTLAWDEPDDPKVLAMIQASMGKGFDFWMLEPRLGGMAAPQRTRLARPNDALRTRVVAMSLADGEPDIAGLIEDGTVTPTKTAESPMRRGRVSKAQKAEEVAKGESVRTRRKGGG